MTISLIGFMGSGKSTLGKQLAKKLNYQFIDLDHYIEMVEKKTINQIFSDDGEAHFRDLESKYLLEVLDRQDQNILLSLGGGTPCFRNNMQVINEKSKSIFLNYPAKLLMDRLKAGIHKRPLLQGKSEEELLDFIQSSLIKRNEYYTQAHHHITTVDGAIEEILELV